MENFIKFCRSLGVHENLLFESDDLGKNNECSVDYKCYLENNCSSVTQPTT